MDHGLVAAPGGEDKGRRVRGEPRVAQMAAQLRVDVQQTPGCVRIALTDRRYEWPTGASRDL